MSLLVAVILAVDGTSPPISPRRGTVPSPPVDLSADHVACYTTADGQRHLGAAARISGTQWSVMGGEAAAGIRRADFVDMFIRIVSNGQMTDPEAA